MIIGITGTNGAGKDLVGQILLKKLGWPYFSLSDELRRIARESNLDLSRATLQKLGDQLREKHGPGYLAQQIVDRAKDDFVVISIRNPSECDPFRAKTKFVLVAVDAPIEIRYARTAGRNRAGEGGWSADDFRRNEEEFEMLGGEFSRQIRNLMQMADFTVINDGTIDQLDEKITQILGQITVEVKNVS